MINSVLGNAEVAYVNMQEYLNPTQTTNNRVPNLNRYVSLYTHKSEIFR